MFKNEAIQVLVDQLDYYTDILAKEELNLHRAKISVEPLEEGIAKYKKKVKDIEETIVILKKEEKNG